MKVQVRDVSSSGMSLVADLQLPVPTKVTIEYLAPGVRVEVFGSVGWCQPVDKIAPCTPHSSGFVLGVELFAPSVLAAVLRWNPKKSGV